MDLESRHEAYSSIVVFFELAELSVGEIEGRLVLGIELTGRPGARIVRLREFRHSASFLNSDGPGTNVGAREILGQNAFKSKCLKVPPKERELTSTSWRNRLSPVPQQRSFFIHLLGCLEASYGQFHRSDDWRGKARCRDL